MKKTKLTALLLCLAMFLPTLAACSEKRADSGEETAGGIAAEPAAEAVDAPEAEEKLTCSVPEDLALGKVLQVEKVLEDK